MSRLSDDQKYRYALVERHICQLRDEVMDTMSGPALDETDHLLLRQKIRLSQAVLGLTEDETHQGYDDDGDPVGLTDLYTYSDGRSTMSFVDKFEHGRHILVWHPDPLHDDNVGQVLLEQLPSGWRAGVASPGGTLWVSQSDS